MTYKELEQKVLVLESEAAKRRSVEEKWLLFMESSTEGFALYDPGLHLLEINNALLDVLPKGTKKEELIGKHISEFAPDTFKTNIHEKFMEALRTREPLSIHDYVPPPEFSRKGVRANIKAFAVGDCLGVVLTDIAERRLIEEKWLLFMESSTEGFALYDSGLHLLEINNALLDVLPEGTKKEDLIGKHISEFAPDTFKTNIHEKFMEVLKTREPLSINDYTPPPEFSRKGVRINIKAFSVGDGLGIVLTDITEQKRVEDILKKREAELEKQNINLEEANIALKVLLKKRDKDREELEKKVMFNMKELAVPVLEKLKKTELDSNQNAYLNVLESNLDEIVSHFPYGLSSKYLNLTPTEIQVANLVRRRATTKEIAELLNSTTRAIEFHRNNIRKKLGIKNKKTNLRSYLLSIPL